MRSMKCSKFTRSMEQFSSLWEKAFPPHSHSVGSPLTPLSVEHTHLSSPALCEKNNWAAHKHHYPLPPAHTHTHIHTHTYTQIYLYSTSTENFLVNCEPNQSQKRFWNDTVLMRVILFRNWTITEYIFSFLGLSVAFGLTVFSFKKNFP